MLDPVPLAGARRQVGHRDRQPGLVGEALQLALPQPDPHAVAAAAVGGDQQPGGGGIAGPAKIPPPVPNALDGEGGSVVIDAEIDPSGIRSDVVDAGGRHLAQVGEGEIVHPNRFGLTLGAQLAAAVLEVSDEFFLLCVDRDRWLAGGLPSLHLRVDEFELGVAVGVAWALAGLAVGLQAEAEPAQQSADQLLAGGEAALGQRASEVALALADPQQGGLGIAADGRVHQLAQSLQQAGLRLHRRLASTARAADAAAEVVPPAAQFGQAAADGAPRDPGRRRHCRYAAAACRPRLAGREQAPPPFVQEWRHRLEACSDARDIDHPSSLDTPGSKAHRCPARSLGLAGSPHSSSHRFGCSGSSPKDELRAIEDALIESIMGASPEETVAELREQGIDPDEGVALLDRMAAEALVAAKRQRLDAAKARVSAFKAFQGGKSDPSARQD